jgi:DNA-binding SARP family transcriptional activator/tetratricopeptide (TPR) repeat protein
MESFAPASEPADAAQIVLLAPKSAHGAVSTSGEDASEVAAPSLDGWRAVASSGRATAASTHEPCLKLAFMPVPHPSNDAAAVWHLALSQAPGVRGADGTRHELAWRDAALLAWLAVEGPTPRARIAALLWPDSSTDSARNSLRQRLFQLRKQLGAELVAGSTTLALAAGVAHDLADGDGVLGSAPSEVGGEFAQWLDLQRSRRRERERASLIELAEMAECARDWADALVHARELLALDPLSEDAHRRVMRLHYLANDRAAALLAFDRCEQVLKDEVGARPSPATLALLEIVSSHATTAQPPQAAVPASVLRPPRLVGRARDLEALAQAWHAGHVLALIGEAGLGKTRLLQEFIDRRPGFVQVAGRPGDAGVPFATLARLLRAIVARDGAAQTQLPAPTRSEIARVLPEFDGSSARQAGEGQRLVLLRAVRALLAAHGSIDTVVVDDLHFADEASIDMLGSLIDGDDEGVERWRWMLAYRPAEAGSAAQALHDRLVEQVRLVPLMLAPLDEAALAELVDSLGLPGIDGRVLAPGLLRRTGGNPLFVLETLKQAWVERTLAQLADARSLPRPLSVGRLIERRIAQLTPRAIALARVAAIAGVDFSVALAEHVLQAPAIALADAIGELEAAQVMRADAFAHDLVADAVRASVPSTVAVHTHAQVAQWLEQHGGEPARVARHWIGGGQSARALPWLAQAATAAGIAVRRKEQVAFLEEKSRIEEACADRAAAFDTLMRAAEIQVTLEQPDGHGLAQCDRLDALADTAAQRVRAGTQRANLAIMLGHTAQAEAIAAEALRTALRARVDAALVVQCRIHLATALSSQDRAAEALTQFEAALAWIDEHADDELRCEFHGNLATTYDRLGRFADARPHHELLVELSRHLNQHGNWATGLSNQASNRTRSGRMQEADALLAQARLVRAQAAEPSSIDGFIAIEQSVCHYQSGRYAQALQTLEEGRRNLLEFAPGYCAALQGHLATCWAHLGQWARLQALLAELERDPDLPRRTGTRLVLLRRQWAVALGQPADRAALEQALASIGPTDAPDLKHALQIELAALGDHAHAVSALARIVEEAEALDHEPTALVARARCAMVAARNGDTALAQRHAVAAQRLGERVTPMYQYPLDPWLHCAQAWLAIGESAHAAALCGRARQWIEDRARHQVPDEFRSSFLHRNPVNRELLALAARLA